MPVEGIGSLDLVFDEVRHERSVQLTHFDAIDTKAGVVLGFSGAIVALSGGSFGALVTIGRALAASSGLLALAAFWPRRFWRTNLRSLRDRYLGSELAFTRVHLLDSQIAMAERLDRALASKVLLLKAAVGSLALVVLVSALGFGIHSP
jgi:hypothetical protein